MHKVMRLMKENQMILIIVIIAALAMIETREGHRNNNKKIHDDLHENLVTKDEVFGLNKKVYDNVVRKDELGEYVDEIMSKQYKLNKPKTMVKYNEVENSVRFNKPKTMVK